MIQHFCPTIFLRRFEKVSKHKWVREPFSSNQEFVCVKKTQKFFPLSFCSTKLKGPMHSCALALLLPGSALKLPITHLRSLSLKPFVKRLSVFKNLTLFEDPLHLLGYNIRSQKIVLYRTANFDVPEAFIHSHAFGYAYTRSFLNRKAPICLF